MKKKSSALATKTDIENLTNLIKNMASKSDVKDMATKSDLKNMATKSDIENMATKSALDALEKYLENLLEGRLQHHSVEIMSHVDVRFEEWRSDFRLYPELIKDHSKRIRRLETKVGIA